MTLELEKYLKTDRKRRLFLTSLCRDCWDQMTSYARAWVVLAEAYADDPVGQTDRVKTVLSFRQGVLNDFEQLAMTCLAGEASLGAAFALSARSLGRDKGRADWLLEARAKMFCGPEGYAAGQWAEDRWVKALAAQAHDEANGAYRPDCFLLLADAAEDAGCDPDDKAIAHLRWDGPRYKGDWVLDVILGRS